MSLLLLALLLAAAMQAAGSAPLPGAPPPQGSGGAAGEGLRPAKECQGQVDPSLCMQEHQEHLLIQTSAAALRRLSARDVVEATELSRKVVARRALQATGAVTTFWKGFEGPIRSALDRTKCLGVRPSSLVQLYEIAARAQDTCNVGATRIVDEAECAGAAVAFNHTYGGEGAFPNTTVGCIDAGTYFYLNSASKVDPNLFFAPVCRKASPPAVPLDFLRCDLSSNSMTFAVSQVDGLIRWKPDSSKCIQLANGITNNSPLQLASCSASSSDQNFTVPSKGIGALRPSANLDKCVDVVAGLQDAPQTATRLAPTCQLLTPQPNTSGAPAFQPSPLRGHYGSLSDFTVSAQTITSVVQQMSTTFGIAEFQFYGVFEGFSGPPAQPESSNVLKVSADYQYWQISQGYCRGVGKVPITSIAGCQTAATALGLPSTAASPSSNSPRPEGCFWNRAAGSLWFATAASNVGVGAGNGWDQICASLGAPALVQLAATTAASAAGGSNGGASRNLQAASMRQVVSAKGLCLQVDSPGLPGSAAHLVACNQLAAGQQWSYSSTGSIQVGSDGCFMINATMDYRAWVWSCSPIATQYQLRYDPVSRQFKNPAGSRCLDHDPTNAQGAVFVSNCSATNVWQVWNLTTPTAAAPSVASQMTSAIGPIEGKCLTINTVGSAGSNVSVKACVPGSASQSWMRNLATGQLSDQSGAFCMQTNPAADWLVQMSPCNAASLDQQWVYNASLLQLFTPSRQKCLDHNMATGTTALSTRCTGANIYQWWMLGSSVSVLPTTTTTTTLPDLFSWRSRLGSRQVQRATLKAAINAVRQAGGRSWLAVKAFATDAGDVALQQGYPPAFSATEQGVAFDLVAPSAAWAAQIVPGWAVFAQQMGFSGIHWDTTGDFGVNPNLGADIPGFLRAALPILAARGLEQSLSFVDGFGWDPALISPVTLGSAGRVISFPYWEVRNASSETQLLEDASVRGFVMASYVGQDANHLGEQQNLAQIGVAPLELGKARWIASVRRGGTYHLIGDGLEYVRSSNLADSVPLSTVDAQGITSAVSLPPRQLGAASALRGHYGVLSRWSLYDFEVRRNVGTMYDSFGAMEIQFYGAWAGYSSPPAAGAVNWTCAATGLQVKRSILQAAAAEVLRLGGRPWLHVKAMAVDYGDTTQGQALIGTYRENLAQFSVVAPNAAWATKMAPAWADFAVSIGVAGIHWETLGDYTGSSTKGADIPGFLRAALPILRARGLEQTLNFVDGFGWDPTLAQDIGWGFAGRVVSFPFWTIYNTSVDDFFAQFSGQGFVLADYPGRDTMHAGEPQNVEQIGLPHIDLAILRWQTSIQNGGTYVFARDGLGMLEAAQDLSSATIAWLASSDVARMQDSIGLPPGSPSPLNGPSPVPAVPPQAAGQIRLAWRPSARSLCLAPSGATPGSPMLAQDCVAAGDASMDFLIPRGVGPLQKAADPTTCLEVVGGTRLQLGTCGGPGSLDAQRFRVPAGGQGLLRWAANPAKCVDFTFRGIRSGDSIFLISNNTGKLLDVQNATAPVQARYTDRGLWQSFVIYKQTGSGLVRSGDTVFLQAQTGNYVDAVNMEVKARYVDRGLWQTLVIERSAGPGPIQAGDAVFLRTFNGTYIDVQNNLTRCRYTDRGSWQMLTIDAKTPSSAATLEDCPNATTTQVAPQGVHPNQLVLVPQPRQVPQSITAKGPLRGHYGSLADFSITDQQVRSRVRALRDNFGILEFQLHSAFAGYSQPPAASQANWTCKWSLRGVQRATLQAAIAEISSVGGRSWLYVQAFATDVGDKSAQMGFPVVGTCRDSGLEIDVVVPSAAWALRIVPQWAAFAASLGVTGIHWDTVGDFNGMSGQGADIPAFLKAALPILEAAGLQQTLNFVDGFGWDPTLLQDAGPGFITRTVSFPYQEIRTGSASAFAASFAGQGFVLSCFAGFSANHTGEVQNQGQTGVQPIDVGIQRWQLAASKGGSYLFVGDGLAIVQGPAVFNVAAALAPTDVAKIQNAVALPPGPPPVLQPVGTVSATVSGTQARGPVQWALYQRKCLGVERNAVGTPNLRLWPCNYSSTFPQFTMPVSGIGQVVSAASTDKCMSVQGGNTANGTPLQLDSCAGVPASQTAFQIPAGGQGLIRWNANPGKCVAAAPLTAGDVLMSGDTIFLRAGTLNMDVPKDNRAHLRWNTTTSWQRFIIWRVAGPGQVQADDTVYLQAWTGNVFAVNNGLVQVSWKNRGTWEALAIRRMAGPGAVRSGDFVAIQSYQGQWLSLSGQDIIAGTSQQQFQAVLDAEAVVIQDCPVGQASQSQSPQQQFLLPSSAAPVTASAASPPVPPALLGNYGFVGQFGITGAEIREQINDLWSNFGIREFQFYDAFQGYSWPPPANASQWNCVVSPTGVIYRQTLLSAIDAVRDIGGRAWLYVQSMASDPNDSVHQAGFTSVSGFYLGSSTQKIFDVMPVNAAWAMRIAPQWADFAQSLGFAGIHWDSLGSWDKDGPGLPGNDADFPGFLRAAHRILRARGLQQTVNFVNGYGWEPALVQPVGAGWAGQAVAFPYWEVWSPADETRYFQAVGGSSFVLAEYPGFDANHTRVNDMEQNGQLVGQEPIDIGLGRFASANRRGGAYILFGEGQQHIRGPYFPNVMDMPDAMLARVQTQLLLPPGLLAP